MRYQAGMFKEVMLKYRQALRAVNAAQRGLGAKPRFELLISSQPRTVPHPQCSTKGVPIAISAFEGALIIFAGCAISTLPPSHARITQVPCFAAAEETYGSRRALLWAQIFSGPVRQGLS
jgi:hypothetical protein